MQDPNHAANASSFMSPHIPSHWPATAELVTWCRAVGPGESALLILVGVVYLLFGINMFKVLVMVNIAALGAALGALIGSKTGSEVPGAIVGAVTGAGLCIP